jgi:hypothetical protein
MRILIEVAMFLVIFTGWVWIANKIINGKKK